MDKLDQSNQALDPHQRKNFAHIDTSRLYTCDVCQKSFGCTSHLRQHKLIHSGEYTFICVACNKGFRTSSNLQQHKAVHTSERKFICNICPKRFKQASGLKHHKAVHTGERKFACNICEKRFNQASYLQQHKAVHTGERKFVCNICQKRFSQSSNLSKHELVHSDEFQYTCVTCSKGFHQKGQLYRHRANHTNERQYCCEICDNKRFKSASHLNRHIKLIHTDGLRHTCNICQKQFSYISNLRQHELLHFRAHKYVCYTCNKVFKQARSLRNHRCIHTGSHLVSPTNDQRLASSSHLHKHESNQSKHQYQPDNKGLTYFSYSFHICSGCHLPLKSKGYLKEHKISAHSFGCGICGEMSNGRDEAKTCFYSHLVYISDSSTDDLETV